ncbi:MAG: CDP-diacylglycerol--glycerol-3-phosphate 3-phosphatidyltransferase, partial [Clostridia bacterium]|nr:CDP-diacylglycerol--glycerol-3-phosphate 3-phosphatidyltransferase [Clostridia bacterium]
MNLPNKITLCRIILIPFMLIIPLFHISTTFLGINVGNLIILAIFLIASITDFWDGYLARKHNLVTDFGKFLDPIADKLLVVTALIMLVEMDMIPSWIPIIIIAREFTVSGIRMIAAGKGNVIAASWYG